MGSLGGAAIGALIVGLATERSIAYGIAKVARREGAELALTYQNLKVSSSTVDAAASVVPDASSMTCA